MDVNELSRRLTLRWIDICRRRGSHPRAPSAVELATINVLLQAIISGPPQTSPTISWLPQDNQLLSTIQSLNEQMDIYESPDLLVRESKPVTVVIHEPNKFMITPRIKPWYSSPCRSYMTVPNAFNLQTHHFPALRTL